jgi:hypothetical protein
LSNEWHKISVYAALAATAPAATSAICRGPATNANAPLRNQRY